MQPNSCCAPLTSAPQDGSVKYLSHIWFLRELVTIWSDKRLVKIGYLSDQVLTNTYNPWVSIWTKPRATIQQIVTTNHEHLVVTRIVLPVFFEDLSYTSMKNLGDKLDCPYLVLTAAIFDSLSASFSCCYGCFVFLLWWQTDNIS